MAQADASESFRTILDESGGAFEGHTQFRNGLHGNGWIEKGFIIRDPSSLDVVTRLQAESIKREFPGCDLIIGIPVCGAVTASYIARNASIELALTEGKGDNLHFHRMNVPDRGRRAVIGEDLIFSGTDIREHIGFLAAAGVELLGISSWISRQGETIDGVETLSLITPPFTSYQPDQCPLCQQGEPLKYTNVRE